MPVMCASCRQLIPEGARFCRYCGTATSRSASQVAPAPVSLEMMQAPPPSRYSEPARPQPAPEQRCPQCGTPVPVHSRFCRRCGLSMTGEDPAMETTQVIPRRTRVIVQQRISEVKPVPYGSYVAGGGAVIALAGCLLPLFNSGGWGTTLVPKLAGHAPLLLLVPLVALVMGLLALASVFTSLETRVMLSGGALALAGMGFAVSLLWCSAVQFAMGQIGRLFGAQQPGLGLGSMLLAAGFLVALIGGFLMLHDATAE